MALTKDAVRRALTAVRVPGQDRDLVESGALQWVAACDTHASVRLYVEGVRDRGVLGELASRVDRAVREGAGSEVTALVVEYVDRAGDVVARFGEGGGDAAGGSKAAEGRQASPGSPGQKAQDNADALPGVRHAIAVGAGKGGVGKSTVAVNLAVGLARQGHTVGLLDGDIYGPSLPTMLGLDALEQNVLEGRLQPFWVHGVKAVTIGKLVEADKPLIWRGPMAHGAFRQLVDRTDWGELDYMIVDLPPGTGDVPLTLAQSLRLTGAVIVCTPQKVAQDDATRAARMFQQLGVEVLGVVENMSFFVADPDAEGHAKEYDIFGRGGAEQMAQRLSVPFLGAVPINTALRQNSDAGDPSANFEAVTAGGEALPRALEGLVRNLESQVTLASMAQGRSRPTLKIS